MKKNVRTSTAKKASKPVATGKKISKSRRAAQKVKSAAVQIRKTTKKMIDDVFLKLVGSRVLERAQEMTKDIKKEKSKGKGRKK